MAGNEQTLAERLLEGDRRALARGISLVEADDPAGWALVKEVYPHTGKGAVIGFTGPPGVGKSTLLAVLAGALESSAGTVETHARVGWVPQRPAHYSRLSVRENLELFARLEGVRDPTAAAEDLLARFSLPTGRRPAIISSAAAVFSR